MFQKELDFEKALVTLLFDKGWAEKVIINPTEEDLIPNWADILFHNNQGKDRLNGQPLTKSEVAQILDQIKTLKTHLMLNGFINGKTVSIKRDKETDTLIVTSIQKMSNIHQGTSEEPSKTINVFAIQEKRLVFIVDECHRSTFGLMLNTIKRTFPHALFFGFTGTPIQDENQKKDCTTADVFGDELHYLDETLEYANMIQGFSRTNRLFGPDKPFGIIRYYRKPT